MSSLFVVVVHISLLFLIELLLLQTADAQSLTNAIHRTQAATERVNDLWCYECDQMDQGEACVNILPKNDTIFHKKCKGEEFICMVKRFSYTTSTENSTSSPKMWSLDRRCTVSCEPGCIVIGERTKLYACTSCCEKNLCNTGRGGAAQQYRRVETGIGTGLCLALLLLLRVSPSASSASHVIRGVQQ